MIPRATYRLQLHRGFDFDAARAVLPYLRRLGVSHVYCSPITRARPGSRHGYDVIDHARINDELGGEEGFLRFARAAHAIGLALLLDQVPNHMGVFGADNAWWADVLENGPAAEHARCFDIDWQPPNPALAGKLLVPVLGDAYGEVLARGEIRLALDAEAGALALHYCEHRFPLDPGTCCELLAGADGAGFEALRRDGAALPPRDAPAASGRSAASRQWRQRLAGLLRERPAAAAALRREIDAINAEPSRDRLHALHEAQAWRLAHWLMAADEINYRRFFDVNELAALRIEDEAVFEAVQGAALDLAAQGWVDGFRIDHPDGLRDPAAYFARLQAGLARRLRAAGAPPRQLYLASEKIVAAHEEVPRDWALHGTTGYRFANLVNGLFVERRHAARMERIWREFGGTADPFDEVVRECKLMIARETLAAQLTTLTHALQRIALADRRTRDYGLHALRDALAETAAAMPVYRTYVTDTASAQDRRFIDWAVTRAQRRCRALPAALFDFLRRCLLDAPEFAMSFQQFCAPVAAKGIEDTAFYRHHRLVSLNEVGGDPATFGVSASAFHGASRDRQRHWPHTLLATSTHDSKRSEDVRCRIDVISEEPAAWRLALRRWRVQTRSWRVDIDGRPAPGDGDLVLLLQTLLGTLPAGGFAGESELESYRARIEAYMQKAAREARLHTDWSAPRADYEEALTALVHGVLGRVQGNPVLADLQARADRIAWFGALNSLATTVLKFCSPGVPDLYQGCELIDLSLVDPDNRRAVDFALRERMLAGFEALRTTPADLPAALAAWAATPADGRLKLWLAWRLLALREAEPALFRDGRYAALRVAGARKRQLIAFARRTPEATLLVLAGRKFATLGVEPGEMPAGEAAWAGTLLRRPEWLGLGELQAFDVLADRETRVAAGPLSAAALFTHFPFAVLRVRTPPRPRRAGTRLAAPPSTPGGIA